MDWSLLGQLIGGLGLFLLGMQLMTSGLKSAAGPALKSILSKATQSRLRGLLTGTAITALVQSSSAVTVATLGFVNAGLMTLGQSITLIYGSNIGTTLTGWLVALIGFKLNIGALMLPLVGIGMALNLFGGGRRITNYGLALAGFGLFFVGLDFLKNAFEGLSNIITFSSFGQGPVALILFVGAGILLTVLTQSSSAVMAIALSMVSVGSLGMSAAAAIVIGANISTTTTALFASIGATPNAKRISAAHVIFNLQTALIGVLVLSLISGSIDRLDVSRFDPVIMLALFHTLFNVAGVILIWPMTDRMEGFLNRRFRSFEEIESRPQYLDDTILASPPLAVEAINRELARANTLAINLAENMLSIEKDTLQMHKQNDAIQTLIAAIVGFNQKLARQNISQEIADTLPASIRVARYISEIARLTSLLPNQQSLINQIDDQSINHAISQLKSEIIELLFACTIDETRDVQGIDSHRIVRRIRQTYQDVKLLILERTIEGIIGTEESIAILDYLTELKRLAYQAEHVSSHWSSTLPIQQRQNLGNG